LRRAALITAGQAPPDSQTFPSQATKTQPDSTGLHKSDPEHFVISHAPGDLASNVSQSPPPCSAATALPRLSRRTSRPRSRAFEAAPRFLSTIYRTHLYSIRYLTYYYRPPRPGYPGCQLFPALLSYYCWCWCWCCWLLGRSRPRFELQSLANSAIIATQPWVVIRRSCSSETNSFSSSIRTAEPHHHSASTLCASHQTSDFSPPRSPSLVCGQPSRNPLA